jgi:hypothetical protein
MALPYGLIFTGGYPVSGGPSPSGGFTDKFIGGVDFYYDAWVIGVHQTEHGDVLRFGPRSLSRDLYGGWHFEIGTRGFKYIPRYNDSVATSGSLVVLAFGFGNKTNYTNISNVALIGAYNVTFGDAEGSGNHNSFPIVELSYALGLRIPMDKNALSVMLQLEGGSGLPSATETVPYYSKATGSYSINLLLQYALNFDKY